MTVRRDGAGTLVGNLTVRQVNRLVDYMTGKQVSREERKHPVWQILKVDRDPEVVCMNAMGAHTWEPNADERCSAALAQRVLGAPM